MLHLKPCCCCLQRVSDKQQLEQQVLVAAQIKNADLMRLATRDCRQGCQQARAAEAGEGAAAVAEAAVGAQAVRCMAWAAAAALCVRTQSKPKFFAMLLEVSSASWSSIGSSIGCLCQVAEAHGVRISP